VDDLPLKNKLILVTGAARRIGRALALASARAGADVIIHYNLAAEAAGATRLEIEGMGRRAWTFKADFAERADREALIERTSALGALYGIVNSAAVFESRSMLETTLPDWERHFAVNLTAPFLLAQAFARQVTEGEEGRVVNILDWRALQPGADHFPYTISKAALAAMTRAMAVALAPRITVNGLALGAILPPADRPAPPEILDSVPARRWGQLQETEEALIFLLSGPSYITGEIIHVDGGRHLV
jgi:NAD(P)-dependent dehydrogenase (short-subunit alcohol dehydrogenase family)